MDKKIPSLLDKSKLPENPIDPLLLSYSNTANTYIKVFADVGSEYRVEEDDNYDDDYFVPVYEDDGITTYSDINALGFDGWEMVDCRNSLRYGKYYIFQRPKNPDLWIKWMYSIQTSDVKGWYKVTSKSNMYKRLVNED